MISARTRQFWVAAAILAATVAAYWPALSAGLVWNDADYVTKPALQSVGGLRRIWFEVGATEQYYPVLHTAFWIEHRLWGGSALGYHLANILLHALAAILFAAVLRRLAIPAAWLGGMLFALHPVAVESVAWISEQKNTLSLVFYLLAALAYLRFDETRRPVAYWLGFAAFAAAVLAKSVTATLPAALLLVAWWRRGKVGWRRDVGPLLPWFGVGAAAGLFTAWVERHYIGAEGPGFQLGFAGRCLVAGHGVWFYLGRLAWPADLIFIYPRWAINAADPAQWLYPAAAAALIGALWLARRWNRGPFAAVLFFVGSLFPALGFFNVYAFVFSYVADHWQYLSALGVCALVAGAWSRWRGDGRGRRSLSAGLAAASVLVAFAVLTWRQTRTYRDAATLYRVTLARNPEAWLAHVNLGNILAGEGRLNDAIGHYRTAAAIVPRYAEIRCNLGDALMRAGHPAEALAAYREAVRLNPAYFAASVNLANTLMLVGKPADAVPEYERALGLRPGEAQVELDLAVALERAGRPADALQHGQAAVRLWPDNADAQRRMGDVLCELGRYSEARRSYERALEIRPGFPEAEYGLGNALGNLGRLDEAIAHYQAAVRTRPAYPEALANLGLALASADRFAEAETPIETALSLRPRYAEGHAYLGFVLARLGRLEQAVREYRFSLQIAPNNPEVQYQLAAALKALGRDDEAAAERQSMGAAPPSASP